MDPFYVQNLRYKLQKRIGRLNYASVDAFGVVLRQFWRFFDQQPMFVGIAQELQARVPTAQVSADKILSCEALFGETEEEAAAIGCAVLRRLQDNDTENLLINLGLRYNHTVKLDSALELVRQIFLEPFYEYVDEQLDDQRAMLSLLMRYKHRSEWFHRDRLSELCKQGGEKELALDLYAYLYDQGIDFMIEPSSLTGEVDLIAAQDTDDPLLLDTKVFDGSSRGKHYIRKGFRQVYTYAQQYNQPCAYLVIFKDSDHDLRFSLNHTGDVPVVLYNHKSIFLITIDIYQHSLPVSKRTPLNAVEIRDEDFVGIIQDWEATD